MAGELREVGITVFRFIALRDRVIAASWLGKVKTVAQAVAISFALFPFWNLIPAWSPGIHVFNELLMAIALVLTVVSGVEYLWQAYKVGRAKRIALPE